MENYGKEGKKDFSIKTGKVAVWEWGTELFQVPLFDQRGKFEKPVTLNGRRQHRIQCPTFLLLQSNQRTGH